MKNTLISIKNLKKDYKTGDVLVTALDGVDITIEKGKFIVILGPSGSGKTTLLNLLGGIDQSTSGKIQVNSRNITEFNEKELTEYRKEDVGFIFQFYNLIPSLSAVENVELSARLNFSSDSYERSLKILELVGLSDKVNNYPSELSGGEQQRVAIARALVKEPKIVLADEPTGNIDTETGSTIINLMLGICRERGTTFLIVTHNVAISKIADEVIYLRDGCIFGTSNPLSEETKE